MVLWTLSAMLTLLQNHMRQERNESARERRTALYKSDQQQQPPGVPVNIGGREEEEEEEEEGRRVTRVYCGADEYAGGAEGLWWYTTD